MGVKLSVIDVREIRDLYATGEYSQGDLAIEYGTSIATIYRIVKGYGFRDVGGPIVTKNHQRSRGLKHDAVFMIRKAYATGKFGQLELANICECGLNSIYNIVNGITYRHVGGPIHGVDYPKFEPNERVGKR